MFKLVFTLIVGIILGGVVAATVIYATPLQYTDTFEPIIRDIDPVAFQKDFEERPDDFIFIDVRGEESYNNLHAVGSLNFPLHTLYDHRHVLPKENKDIILICSGGRASGVAYSYLEHFGFTNIYRIEGGIEAWSEKGLPTERAQ